MHDWRPAIQEVKEAVESLYDLPVAAVTQLAGYDDLNYKVQSGEKFYVLKIKHLAYDGGSASSILTNHIMVHLFDNDLNVPQAIHPKSDTGTTVQYQFESSKSPRMMQLFTFLPGRSIFESRPTPERLMSIAYRVGKLCSVYMESLQILTRRMSLENNQVRETNDMWKPHNFLRARPLLHYVTDEKLKEIISEYFDLFQKTFSLVQNKLRRGLIHGDFSTTNIIEDEDGQLGVLDFEDSGFNYIVFDLAICIAYFMVSALDVNADPMRSITNLYKGFSESPTLSLNKDEIDILYLGVIARLVTSYVMSRYNVTMQPGNEEYLSCQASKCPALIRMMHSKGRDQVMKEWGIIAST